MIDDEIEPRSKSVWGRKLNDIPCYRDSLLWGIGGGFTSGLLYFLFTSKPQIAGHVAMGMFMGTTMVYWMQCRHAYFSATAQIEAAQKALEQRVAIEGTAVEKELEKKLNLDFKSV